MKQSIHQHFLKCSQCYCSSILQHLPHWLDSINIISNQKYRCKKEKEIKREPEYRHRCRPNQFAALSNPIESTPSQSYNFRELYNGTWDVEVVAPRVPGGLPKLGNPFITINGSRSGYRRSSSWFCPSHKHWFLTAVVSLKSDSFASWVERFAGRRITFLVDIHCCWVASLRCVARLPIKKKKVMQGFGGITGFGQTCLSKDAGLHFRPNLKTKT